MRKSKAIFFDCYIILLYIIGNFKSKIVHPSKKILSAYYDA